MKYSAEEMIDAMGAMCEISGFLLKGFLENGFTREEAVSLVGDFVAATFYKKQEEK